MEKTLDQMKPGEKGTVVKVLAVKKLKSRLLDMGLTPGAEVFVRKLAPLGDPIEITVRDYELSVRKKEAENVLMSL